MADKQLWQVTPVATDVKNDDGVIIGGQTAGTRYAPLTLIANFVHNLWAAFINAITPLKTSFVSGDKIPVVNGSTATAMEADTLLELTAQNASQYTISRTAASEFNPNRTAQNPYKTGENVSFDGKVYKFTSNHYGVWTGNDVIENSLALNIEYILTDETTKDTLSRQNTFSSATKNLFNYDLLIPGYYSATGAYFSESGWCSTQYIIIDASKTYSWNLDFVASVTYDANKNFIERIVHNQNRSYSYGNNVKYVRLCFFGAKPASTNFMFVEGAVPETFEPFGNYVKFENIKNIPSYELSSNKVQHIEKRGSETQYGSTKSIVEQLDKYVLTEDLETFAEKRINLFDNRYIRNGYFNTSTGEFVESNDARANLKYIKVEGGETYSFSSDSYVGSFTYDENMNFIERIVHNLSTQVTYSNNVHYVRLVSYGGSASDGTHYFGGHFMFVKGALPSYYVEYGYSIDEVFKENERESIVDECNDFTRELYNSIPQSSATAIVQYTIEQFEGETNEDKLQNALDSITYGTIFCGEITITKKYTPQNKDYRRIRIIGSKFNINVNGWFDYPSEMQFNYCPTFIGCIITCNVGCSLYNAANGKGYVSPTFIGCFLRNVSLNANPNSYMQSLHIIDCEVHSGNVQLCKALQYWDLQARGTRFEMGGGIVFESTYTEDANYLRSVVHAVFTDCIIEGRTDYFVKFGSAYDVHFVNNYFEGNSYPYIYIDRQFDVFEFVGNYSNEWNIQNKACIIIDVACTTENIANNCTLYVADPEIVLVKRNYS